MKHSFKPALLVVASALLLSGCGNQPATSTSQSSVTPGSSAFLGYTVKFVTNGGTAVSDFVGTVIESEPVSEQSGKILEGWHVSPTLDDEKLIFPYAVTSDMTLYAKWNQGKTDPEGTYIMSCYGKVKNEGKMYLETAVLEDSVSFTFNVKDATVYTANTNTGLNDNVELHFGPISQQGAGRVAGVTRKILVDAKGSYFYQKASGEYDAYGSSISLPSGYEIDATKRTEAVDGYNGYSVEIEVPFSDLGIADATEMSFAISMRNSDSSFASNYAESYYMDSEVLKAHTYLGFDQNGKIIRANAKFKNLILGDSYTDFQFYNTFNNEFGNSGDFYDIGVSGSKISEWLNWESRITSRNVENLFIHIGVNDIDGGVSAATTFANFKQFCEDLHAELPNMKIHFITVLDNLMFAAKKNDYHSYNDSIKNWAATTDYVKIIDFAAAVADENTGYAKKDMLLDGLHPSDYGYAILTHLIAERLGIEDHVTDSLGHVGEYYTGRGYNEENGTITNTGTRDSYAFFKDVEALPDSVSASFQASRIYNVDQYPKFGFILKNADETTFFYIDGENKFASSKVGIVKGKYTNGWIWDWNASKTTTVTGLVYSGISRASLKIAHEGSNIAFYVNGTSVLSIEDTGYTGTCYAGLLGFNVGFNIKNLNIEK